MSETRQVPPPSGQETMRPPPRTQTNQDYFVYPLLFASVATTVTAQGQIQIQADSDFEWLALTAFAFDPAAPDQTENTRIIPPFRMQVTDSGSGRQLYNVPVALDAISGRGELPYILPIGRIFRARSSILIEVTNFGANTRGLDLALHGRKIFKMN